MISFQIFDTKLRILWKWHKTSFSYTFPWPREKYISLRIQILRKWKHRSLLSVSTDFMGLALIISKDNPRENKISCFFNWSHRRTQTEGDKQMKLQIERHCWWSKSDRHTDIIQIQPGIWNMHSYVWSIKSYNILNVCSEDWGLAKLSGDTSHFLTNSRKDKHTIYFLKFFTKLFFYTKLSNNDIIVECWGPLRTEQQHFTFCNKDY